MHVNVLNIRAQKMPVFPSLEVEAEASFAGFELPPSPFWIRSPSSLR